MQQTLNQPQLLSSCALVHSMLQNALQRPRSSPALCADMQHSRIQPVYQWLPSTVGPPLRQLTNCTCFAEGISQRANCSTTHTAPVGLIQCNSKPTCAQLPSSSDVRWPVSPHPNNTGCRAADAALLKAMVLLLRHAVGTCVHPAHNAGCLILQTPIDVRGRYQHPTALPQQIVQKKKHAVCDCLAAARWAVAPTAAVAAMRPARICCRGHRRCCCHNCAGCAAMAVLITHFVLDPAIAARYVEPEYAAKHAVATPCACCCWGVVAAVAAGGCCCGVHWLQAGACVAAAAAARQIVKPLIVW